MLFPTYLLITIGNTIPDFYKTITRQKSGFYVIPLTSELEPREPNFRFVDDHESNKINGKQFDFDKRMNDNEDTHENEIILNPKPIRIDVKPYVNLQ